MRRLLRFTGILVGILIGHLALHAQPCATLQVVGPPGGTIPCDSALNLTASITFPTGINNTSTYTGDTIAFNPAPYVGPNPILVNIDDIWSGVLALPFPFCYFGNTYNSFLVSSNGQVGFDLSQAGLFNSWATTSFGPCPVNNATFNNTIMGPHHDIYPVNAGATITWGVFGIAPCRTMVVTWLTCQMFSCTSLIDTQQIVLHELTNIIDINIASKPLCSTWNGGLAYEGIQNSTGTVAIMTPGRNGTQWTAHNDAYRFTPAGAPTPISYVFTWTNAQTGAILGTGQTLTIPPPVTLDSVKCQVDVSGGCAPYSFSTVYHVGVGKVNALFTYQKHYGCDQDTVVFNNITNPQTGTTYTWFFGDLATSTSANPTHIYANQGTYTVRLIADHPPCIKDTFDQVIVISHPIKAVVTVKGTNGKDSVCLGSPMTATSASTVAAGLTTYQYIWGDGTDTTLNSSTPVQHTYTAPGPYTVTHIITDTLGCKDSVKYNVFVDNPPFEAFTLTPDSICVGDLVFFKDTLAPYVQWFEWNFGDGKRLKNVHNPFHSWDKVITPNPFQVYLVAHYLICPADSVSQTIEMDDYPIVNLGPDTAICPGLTSSILLSNISNPFALNNLWNTGETAASISVTEPGHYWLKVVSDNGKCATADSIWIKRDCYLNIPNSFSPNGDGRNDYFLPREILASGLKSFTMTIFNRWGENIFTTNAIDGRGWDGKYNGVDQPVGVYVYVINAEFMNSVKKEFKGNVTLLR